MADRPILFSAPMVRALLHEIEAPGTGKTQTRRVMNPQPSGLARVERISGTLKSWTIYPESNRCTVDFKPPKIATGDRLWVREAFSYEVLDVDRNGFMPPWYWADGNPSSGDFTRPKPSIHMPRWASRITLLVTDVRVERLQDCSEADAIAEGVSPNSLEDRLSGSPLWIVHGTDFGGRHAIAAYTALWDYINGPGAWAANPWVAAYTFRPILGNIDQIEAPDA